MLRLNGQRVLSFSQITIFGMIFLMFYVQSFNCFVIQDYQQNNSNQDGKIEDGLVNFRSDHQIIESLKEIAASINIIANYMERDPNLSRRISKKAGFDLGLSRGYSGAKQAKHLLELASAGAGYGPGK